MKKKSKITHAQLVAEGVVIVPDDCKPTAKTETPVPTAVDVVTRPTPQVNVAPTPIERATRKLPQATGLQRAINANIEAQGGHVATAPEKTDSATGLQRAINANIAAQRK